MENDGTITKELVVGKIEGYLYGEIRMNIVPCIPIGNYKVTFEIRNDDGYFYTVQVPFPVHEYENVVIFTNTEEYASLYMRVTARYYKEIPDCHTEKNECANLNINWKTCT